MENGRVELTGGKNLIEVKIQRKIFQGNALSPLLFVIVMILLNYILRKCTGGYKLYELQGTINHLIVEYQSDCNQQVSGLPICQEYVGE